MLRAVVENFLKSLTEREFDGPLLAMLSSQGFTDIHFTHGGFEFGKDVIAKKEAAHAGILSRLRILLRWGKSSRIRQYAIQSKAGDIGLAEWRAVRPQLEECEYNTLSHPSFDESLPRVAVLVTTGHLKGAAAPDAQQFKKSCKSRGLASFEIWDEQNLLNWLCNDPTLGLTAANVQDELLALVSSINGGSVTEPELERFSRRWLAGESIESRLKRASIETSVVCSLLRKSQRLDLAALMSLHLYRTAWQALPGTVAESALRLFTAYAIELLEQVEPLLGDPRALAGALTVDPLSVVIYPAACSRMIEIFGLLALGAGANLADRAAEAVRRLCSDHPGCYRPIADQFAVSLIAPTVVLARHDRGVATSYLKSVATWLLDRHDPAHSGLGLADLQESEEVAIERVLGGSLAGTTLQARRQSYIATVLMDLISAVGAQDLYEAVRGNLEAMRVVPTMTAADEAKANWRRGGPDVWPQPRVDYKSWTDPRPDHYSYNSLVEPMDCLYLLSVCRSRHYVTAIAALLDDK
ncbi:hypothetical protein H7H82_11825 [Mycobacterium heidelbergense]|uniref:Uncharacterized protein n=1 Tax=Mycobacterium heidelbergense TaxID=53376 RepID=A0A1X0DB47_MYCHE|nr:hypothetical protein [Mycobacterium heidelbergense]MCV7051275.1 hypothetical protein [Mycobacterium heidelbergense]ORA69603.1 hypothetical protein BST25_21225 [Mycobacterium heidelbergense]BBZ51991.1 hypothetical protein MHEI_37080 [Mycobacterium heidelbergense]